MLQDTPGWVITILNMSETTQQIISEEKGILVVPASDEKN